MVAVPSSESDVSLALSGDSAERSEDPTWCAESSAGSKLMSWLEVAPPERFTHIHDLPFMDEAWRPLAMEVMRFLGGIRSVARIVTASTILHSWYYCTFDPNFAAPGASSPDARAVEPVVIPVPVESSVDVVHLCDDCDAS